jgi:hypothetical protein
MQKRRLSTSSEEESDKPSDEKKYLNDFLHGFSLHSPAYETRLKVDLKEIPRPEHEYLRSKLTLGFHKSFEEKFKNLFHMRFAPKDSLNRFLYEQLSLKHTSSLSIPKPENILNLDTIDKEITTAFPLTSNLRALKGTQWKLEKNIKDCLQIGYALYKETNIYANSRHLKEILNSKQHVLISDEYLEKYGSIREKYFEPFKGVFEQKIKEIKLFLYREIKEVIKKTTAISKASEEERTLTIVDVDQNSEKCFIIIRYKDCKFRLTKYHFKKLEKLFEISQNNHEQKSSISFNQIVFCLTCRYQTFFRNNEQINEGYGMQAALPSRVLAELNELFEVSQEMFASPFNCFFKSYCSAFFDTDVFFGSNGSFFDFEPETGIILFNSY